MPRHGHARTELHVAEASTVQRIPLEQIRVLNPRVRNRQVFARLVENIAALGLKRPITVTPATRGSDAAFEIMGIRNFWLIKCQRCKEENLSQRII